MGLQRRKTANEGVEVMSPGGLLQTLGPVTANDRSGPVRSTTVTRHDGRTSSRLVDDDRRRLRDGVSADQLYVDVVENIDVKTLLRFFIIL